MEGTPTDSGRPLLTREKAQERAQLTENALRAAGTPEDSIRLAVSAILRNAGSALVSDVDTNGQPVS